MALEALKIAQKKLETWSTGNMNIVQIMDFLGKEEEKIEKYSKTFLDDTERKQLQQSIKFGKRFERLLKSLGKSNTKEGGILLDFQNIFEKRLMSLDQPMTREKDKYQWILKEIEKEIKVFKKNEKYEINRRIQKTGTTEESSVVKETDSTVMLVSSSRTSNINWDEYLALAKRKVVHRYLLKNNKNYFKPTFKCSFAPFYCSLHGQNFSHNKELCFEENPDMVNQKQVPTVNSKPFMKFARSLSVATANNNFLSYCRQIKLKIYDQGRNDQQNFNRKRKREYDYTPNKKRRTNASSDYNDYKPKKAFSIYVGDGNNNSNKQDYYHRLEGGQRINASVFVVYDRTEMENNGKPAKINSTEIYNVLSEQDENKYHGVRKARQFVNNNAKHNLLSDSSVFPCTNSKPIIPKIKTANQKAKEKVKEKVKVKEKEKEEEEEIEYKPEDVDLNDVKYDLKVNKQINQMLTDLNFKNKFDFNNSKSLLHSDNLRSNQMGIGFDNVGISGNSLAKPENNRKQIESKILDKAEKFEQYLIHSWFEDHVFEDDRIVYDNLPRELRVQINAIDHKGKDSLERILTNTQLEALGTIKNKQLGEIQALYDTGATCDIISRELALSKFPDIIKKKTAIKADTANGQVLLNEFVDTDILVNGYLATVRFFLMDNIKPHQIILGRNTLAHCGFRFVQIDRDGNLVYPSYRHESDLSHLVLPKDDIFGDRIDYDVFKTNLGNTQEVCTKDTFYFARDENRTGHFISRVR